MNNTMVLALEIAGVIMIGAGIALVAFYLFSRNDPKEIELNRHELILVKSMRNVAKHDLEKAIERGCSKEVLSVYEESFSGIDKLINYYEKTCATSAE